MNKNLVLEHLRQHQLNFIHFVDISHLPEDQNKGYATAILFGTVFSKPYLKEVTANRNYVAQMKQNNTIKSDEFYLTELKTDGIADKLAQFIRDNGYSSYSQSEKNVEATGFYNSSTYTTPLPHKTIALQAGLGWIGKHNLLVTEQYGSAISMCSVLTNAPLQAIRKEPLKSKCGTCSTCQQVCLPNAIKGELWHYGMDRDDIIAIKKCSPCLQCLVQCPWTQKYINS
ncbi:epoxyqueuosine reductase [Prolixibacteraceae bacterium JC049]|nr:epoxyqueuosine reductase [Prolixibacteraceae bacterium JC049]